MLTINEIKNKKFEKAAFGYKVDDVEKFLNDVIVYINALENENAENQKKLLVLANKIEEYRNDEDSLRQALLGAQKLGDNILKEAKNRAEIMMRDATIKSENIVNNVKDEVKREEVILNKMKREVDAFRTQMLTMYSSHIEMIKSIPEVEREKMAEQEAVKEAEPVTVEAPVVDEPTIEAPAVSAVKEEEAAPAETVEVKAEEKAEAEPEKKEEGFTISNDFKFSRFDNGAKKESKFGPLKFGDSYDIDGDTKH